MTGTASTLDGESKLQFTSSSSNGSTLTQNKEFLASGNLYGFVSNVSGSDILNDYKTNFSYTGETIVARNVNPSGIAAGQLCVWCYDTGSTTYGFKLADSTGPALPGVNTGMLAICLGTTSSQTVSSGGSGTFLLKGFVSSNKINVNGATEGEPLYMQANNGGGAAGDMTITANWTGTSGTDVWRCVGYYFASTTVNGTSLEIVRFDPSTDYIV